MKILIVRLSSFGDILHGFPVAASLRRAFPEARIDWLVDRKFAGVVELSTSIDSVIYLERQKVAGPTGPFEVVARARSAGYDWAIDIQGLLKSAVMARLSRADRIIGFTREHLKERLSSLFYSEQHDPSPYTHIIEKNLGLLRALGIHNGDPEFRIRMRGEMEHFQKGNGYGVIHVGTSKSNKRWPAESMGQLASALFHRHGIRPFVVYGPQEEEIARTAFQASEGTATIASALTLTDLMSHLGQARIFIGCDSGPLHLAAALGIPLVGIYGPTDPRRHGPRGESASVVSHFSSCQCKYKRSCTSRSHCLSAIDTDEVMNAVDHLLSRTSSRLLTILS